MKRFNGSRKDVRHAATGGARGRLLLALLTCLSSMSLPVQGDDLMPLFQPVSTRSDEPAHFTPAPPASTPAVPPAAPEPLSPKPKVADPAPFVKPQTGSPAPQPAAPPAGRDPGDLQYQKDQRFRELRRQLEILNQLAQQPAVSDLPPGEFKRPHSSSDSEQENPSETSGTAVPVPPMKDKPHPDHQPGNRSQAPDELNTGEEGSSGTPPSLVVEGTIDRFALATSLFATGQTEVCLDVLKHTDLKQLSREDQVWAEYLHACCQRRAGRIDLARQSYRRILAEKDADWIGPLARWWLDELDAKSRLHADIARLAETLTAWEAEIDTLGKPTTTRTTAAQ